jgi:hypothetical protein
MTKKWPVLFGACALLAGMGVASAQQENAEPECPPGQEPAPPPVATPAPPPAMAPPVIIEQPPPAAAPAPVARAHHRAADWSPDNMSLTAGGGVGNFVRERISDGNSAVAGVWDVRYLYGTRHLFGVEGSYQGSAAGGSDEQGTGRTMTQQFAGSLRYNVTRARIQPFLTAGAGWANLHRNLTEPVNGVEVANSVNSFEVPFGAGIAGYVGHHAVIDVRGNYTIITNKDFSNTGARPDMWTAELRGGYAF